MSESPTDWVHFNPAKLAPEPEPEPEPELVIIAELHRNTNMGDHGEYIVSMHGTMPGETIESLVRHHLVHTGSAWKTNDYEDWITLRLVKPAQPTPPKETRS